MSISVQSIYNWYRNLLRHPQYRWWVVLGTLVYLISPIDIVPDVIPIAGQIDDIMVLTLFMTEISQVVLNYAKSRKDNENAPSPSETDQTVDVEAESVSVE